MNTQHELAQRYSVRSMPTFVFLLDGKKTNEFSGAGEQQVSSPILMKFLRCGD